MFDYPAHMRESTATSSAYSQSLAIPRPGTATIRLLFDQHNGITLSRLELEGTPTDRDPRASRRSIDQLMTMLAASPIRGTSLTVAGLPALEYEFAYSVSPVPSLWSHCVVLINSTTQYLINCESTDTHREEMTRVTEVILSSLRRLLDLIKCPAPLHGHVGGGVLAVSTHLASTP